MARPEAAAADRVVETWETAIAGTVWVWVYNRRQDQYELQRVGGSEGSRRLHITRDDRKHNQEQVPFENRGADPFTNGALRLIDTAGRDEHLDVRYHYSDTDLCELFEIRDVDLFIEAVGDIKSELVIRRIAALAETKATLAQSEALRELTQTRYPVGGTQKTVREMLEAGERIGATYI